MPDFSLLLWILGVPYNLEGREPGDKYNQKHSRLGILCYLISVYNDVVGLHAVLLDHCLVALT